MVLRRSPALLAPLVLALACASTPPPGSREAKQQDRIEELEAQNAAMKAELARQRPRLAPSFDSVTRAEGSARGRDLGCALVRSQGAPAVTNATPARFTIAARKHRLTATFAAPQGTGKAQVSTGRCSVVSP